MTNRNVFLSWLEGQDQGAGRITLWGGPSPCSQMTPSSVFSCRGRGEGASWGLFCKGVELTPEGPTLRIQTIALGELMQTLCPQED